MNSTEVTAQEVKRIYNLASNWKKDKAKELLGPLVDRFINRTIGTRAGASFLVERARPIVREEVCNTFIGDTMAIAALQKTLGINEAIDFDGMAKGLMMAIIKSYDKNVEMGLGNLFQMTPKFEFFIN